jgi:cell division septation protein DedD
MDGYQTMDRPSNPDLLHSQMGYIIPTDTNRHQQTPTDTSRHQQTPTDTNRHQQTPTDTNRHQQTPTDTNRHNRHQQTPTDTNRHQQTPTDTSRHQVQIQTAFVNIYTYKNVFVENSNADVALQLFQKNIFVYVFTT